MADIDAGRVVLTNAINQDWSIFDELADLPEAKRRRILRSHREEPLLASEVEEIRLWKRLKAALNRLLLFELAVETGYLEFPPPPRPPLLPASPLPPSDGFDRLLDSSAFRRYLDAYLYFGIRFIAGRVHPDTLYTFPRREDQDVNELPVALPTPPAVVPGDQTDVAVHMLRFFKSIQIEQDEDVHAALLFLDDFVEFSDEQAQFELWLRGLLDRDTDDARFSRIRRGLLKYGEAKADFYAQLEDQRRLQRWNKAGQIKGAWSAMHVLSARFGMNDLHFLSRLLRVDVSPAGLVASRDHSWLRLIAAGQQRAGEPVTSLNQIDEVLHGVLDYVCDLVQNAVTIAREGLDRLKTPDEFSPKVPHTVDWRTTYDEELDEITRQRAERRFDEAVTSSQWRPEVVDGSAREWSRRIRTGEHVGDLVGLAFSGGGIRSATVNLGVLQRLQELDLLRQVDYLSTVSGGGYIGAWLLGNVHRTPYWLVRLTDWSASIAHLRRYSNYLAPRAGLMSADTWTMWLSWIRNATLIQWTAAVWVAVLLVLTRLFKFVFDASAFSGLALFPGNLVLVVIVAVLTIFVYRSLHSETASISEGAVHGNAVVPVWVGSFLTAAMLWASRVDGATYAGLLQTQWRVWLAPLTALLLSFAIVSWCSIGLTPHKGQAAAEEKAARRRGYARVAGAAAVAIVSIVLVYLGLCGVQWFFGHMNDEFDVWVAYVGGGPLIVFVMGLAIIAIIGLVGPDSPDWRREWWTRFGAWLGIYGLGFFALGLTSVFGPALIIWALNHARPTIQWGAVLSWAATVAGGLYAGHSEKTDGEERESTIANVLDWFGRFAAVLFIVGALLLVATGLHALLAKIWTDVPVRPDYWKSLDAISAPVLGLSFVVLIAIGAIMSWRFEINIFGLNQFYRNRLIRCYLGATRWRPGMRKPHKFTGFDQRDDLPLWLLRQAAPNHTPFRGPFPLINCSLNLGGSSDLAVHTRHSASFVLTPLRCGADRRQVGYAPTSQPREQYAGGIFLGQAISVSGAAASPNMGYSTSPLVAVLLTMFNVRLAWWFPNPGRKAFGPFVSLYYLVKELFGLADEKSHFINVSDGGHFENLGVYELIRRRCKVIIACDAECDSALSFGSLGNLVRICETDFGARIDIDVRSIERQKGAHVSRAHCAVGRIAYANGSQGYLIYLKSSITGDEDIGIAQYRAAHPAFPHESTGDQFFAEDQFESYRRLGYHITAQTFRSVETEQPDLIAMAGRLADLWIPGGVPSDFVTQANEFAEMMERFRQDPKLHALFRELMTESTAQGTFKVTNEERAVCLQLLQVMENAYLALRLDDFWTHPDNRGWVVLFSMWARSKKFRQVWNDSHNVYGIRFGYFCHERLGLPIEGEAQRT